MIKEMAFSLSNRFHFCDASQVPQWYGTNKDTFMSLYDYDDYVKDFVKKNSKLAGFDGKIYIPSEFLLDVDGTDVDDARQKAIGLTLVLHDLMVPYNAYFSGTGFHVGIPHDAFLWEGARDLHLKVKDALTEKGIFEYADPSVTDKSRIIRLLNTRNSKSNLFKIYLTPQELHLHPEEIIALAKRSREIDIPVQECNPVFDVMLRKSKAVKIKLKKPLNSEKPDLHQYPCIQSMLINTEAGGRHAAALRIAAHLRWRFPKPIVETVMNYWRETVDKDGDFNQTEIDRLIDSTYNGHGGQGIRYGCNDAVMDKHCQSTCKLYKAKKNQNALNSDAMEKLLMDFIQSDIKPIDIGALYDKKFPIYPGEVVIVQGPPKSMKTMLLQNWLNALKKETYFLEMEMSPRQMMMRFAMMETGMSEEEITESYRQGVSITDKFKWLTIDFNPCRSFELSKRIDMQPKKPEIVVVDHMGLFHSAHKDNNMKVEEASQALMELAIQKNVVVFAVSEIGKESYREGQNIASTRGSFRVAYNANKIIGITGRKDDDGLLEFVDVQTIANRERETLNMRFSVNNVTLTPATKEEMNTISTENYRREIDAEITS
jgi:KaiC/GvpD/RAD55 family RecA-like ATPase